jgi:DNA polymerase-4
MNLKERVILHVDANNFFASVEMLDKPHLKNKPVAVAGNPEKRTGIILAKNELAKKTGVLTGEPLWQAHQKCPDIVFLPPHHSLYNEYSIKLMQIYKTYTDIIEPFGIDECWLDVSGSMRLFESGQKIAELIKERTKKELGLTVSIGVSFCKIFAKIGSDLKKPDAITNVSKKDFKNIVYPLPINTLMGIGRRMTSALNKMNVFTLGQLANMPTNVLKSKFGKIGVELKEKLEGYDTEKVAMSIPTPKSVGNGTTTVIDIETEEEIFATINFLSQKIAARLREKNLYAGGVSIDIKSPDFRHACKEKRLHSATNSGQVIAQNALDLLKEFWCFEKPVRAVTIKTFALIMQGEMNQTSIFFDERKRKLGYGLDEIRHKYGNDALLLASTIKNKKFLDNRN